MPLSRGGALLKVCSIVALHVVKFKVFVKGSYVPCTEHYCAMCHKCCVHIVTCKKLFILLITSSFSYGSVWASEIMLIGCLVIIHIVKMIFCSSQFDLLVFTMTHATLCSVLHIRTILFSSADKKVSK